MITQKRAQEILQAIHNAPFGWQRDTAKDEERGIMTREERKEIMKKWDTMPGYTCFADALIRLANGEGMPTVAQTCLSCKYWRTTRCEERRQSNHDPNHDEWCNGYRAK